MIVVAVEHFDVDARFSHPACEFAKLPRLALIQPLHYYLSHCQNLDSHGFQRVACSLAIGKKEVSYAMTIDHKSAAAFDANARATQRFTHLRERSRSILKCDCDVLHSSISWKPRKDNGDLRGLNYLDYVLFKGIALTRRTKRVESATVAAVRSE